MTLTELCAIITAIASLVMMLVKTIDSEKTLEAIAAAKTHSFFRNIASWSMCVAGVGIWVLVLLSSVTPYSIVAAAIGAAAVATGLAWFVIAEVARRIISRAVLTARAADERKDGRLIKRPPSGA